MIHAYRTIEIPLSAGDIQTEIRVPLTISLLRRLEEAIEASGKSGGWFKLNRQASLLDVFMRFAEPYIPSSLDRDLIQPAFYPLFFSLVRKSLMDSLNDSVNSMNSTEESQKPTDERTQELGQQ